MALKKFFGTEDITDVFCSTNVGNSAGSWWQSDFTGVITHAKFYICNTDTGNFKYVIYKDGSSENDSSAVLGYTSGDIEVENQGWQTESLTPFAVDEDEYLSIIMSQGDANIRSAIPSVGDKIYVNTSYYYSSFNPPDPYGSGWISSSNYTSVFSAYGWEVPIISSIDNTYIRHGLTCTITGTDFMDSGATLELCNNSTYGSATTKLEQNIISQTDTSITFSVNSNTIVGPSYLFLTTELSQINATGLEVNAAANAFVTDDDGNVSKAFSVYLTT